MISLRLIVAVFGAVFLTTLIVVIALSCSGGGDDGGSDPTPTPTQAPTGSGPPEQALARYVETELGKTFFEDCSKAQPGEDAGKICSIFRGERSGQRAYVLGLVASEPSQWAILEQQGGAWKVVYAPKISFDTSGLPGVPWSLKTGVDVVVVGTAPDCLNVHTEPKLVQGNAVDCIKDGAKIKLSAGPVEADGYQWWQVEGRAGWVVADYLRYPDAAQ